MDAKASYPQGHYHISQFDQQQLLIRNQVSLVTSLLRLTDSETPFNQINAFLKGTVTNRKLNDATVQRLLNLRTAVAFITGSPEGFELLTFSHINDLVTAGVGLGGGELRKMPVVTRGDQTVKLPLPEQAAVQKDLLDLRLDHSDYTDRALQAVAYVLHKQLFSDGNLETALLVGNQVLAKRGAGLLLVADDQQAAFRRVRHDFYRNADAETFCRWLYANAIVGPEGLR
ncbi:hypothetical protein LZY01_12560 [Levilactobacillus zymae]|uniref:Fido domain-containing protein n=1 Tax=Levilactobacillus zymae TaxID=267363 RepID=A0ABQ0WWR2_9LACO|nr:hypothetical protein [Levilactobacillus zymae]KRL08688.1 hypothetical protein FD38_GL002317 [Levilactobacillus zymae DSM 19395]QFR61528.1 hypothetical protein LZ395_08360 [Levilactobacillus zymae]GEO72088.1 hypothetical protein LZY01_12560 [Levilactobacillus zymae]